MLYDDPERFLCLVQPDRSRRAPRTSAGASNPASTCGEPETYGSPRVHVALVRNANRWGGAGLTFDAGEWHPASASSPALIIGHKLEVTRPGSGWVSDDLFESQRQWRSCHRDDRCSRRLLAGLGAGSREDGGSRRGGLYRMRLRPSPSRYFSDRGVSTLAADMKTD